MGSKFENHLLKKLKKDFEKKRNKDKHHEKFRWNRLKYVKAIARKMNKLN